MEFTEMKKCLFGGYNKDDVIKYISELNEEHSIELNAKSDMYNDLKSDTDTKVLELSNKNKHSLEKIAELEESILKLNTKLDEYTKKYDCLKSEYDELDKQSRELREKSSIISTAIINAEKCAGRLLDEANANAHDMVTRAERKVEVETAKLGRAKDYVARAREEMLEVMRKIDSELKDAQASLDTKQKMVENNVSSDVESAEKFGVIQKPTWGKRA